MSDDLVKRLRDHIAVSFDDRGHVFEDEVLCDDAAHRIEELEAKLAKAVEFIEDLTGCEWPYDEDAKCILAELTGGQKDD